jgi:hypothetical protein
MAVLDKLFPKKITIDPSKTYVVLIGHVSKAGSFATGQVYRGSHPGPQTAPIYWAETGLADDELADLKAERGLYEFAR